jgi:hypothetical protein
MSSRHPTELSEAPEAEEESDLGRLLFSLPGVSLRKYRLPSAANEGIVL